jgi:hypothetical protein
MHDGRPLPESVRAFFEPRFGHDFSQVRVHTDVPAAEAARAVHARAYTLGTHIAFAAGQFAPRAPDGLRLLAHELTHVVQQQGPALSGTAAPAVIQRLPIDCEKPAITGVQDPTRDPVREVREAHGLAVRYAPIALAQIDLLRSGASTPIFVRPALDFHFGTPNAANLTVIRNRFAGIVRRLDRGADAIYHCNRGGECTGGETWAHQRCPADGYRTRLCPPFFQFGSVARALTLVHEAVHAVGACQDVVAGATNYPGPTPTENAWSYEGFTRAMALTMGPIPLRRRVPQAPPSATTAGSSR